MAASDNNINKAKILAHGINLDITYPWESSKRPYLRKD
jgi:hypothetical protein